MDEITAQIEKLELKLLHTDMCANPSRIDELLAQDFEEIGSNGKTASRREVVAWLMQKDKDEKWSLRDFRIKRLSDDMVIAIYRAVKADRAIAAHSGSIRTSIWRRCGDHWKMVFHQATKSV